MITLIAGPPCSGKNTLAAEQGVRVLDWDALVSDLTGRPMHDRSRLDPLAYGRASEALVAQLQQAHAKGEDVVAVRAAPERWHRGMYRRLYQARVIVLPIPTVECIRRLHESERPKEWWPETERGIRWWWEKYEPSPKDEVYDFQHHVVATGKTPG